ncbi:MAG: helix-turn-helix domain-containing protein [Deltaproteobacteria bacterium]|nr:MAG: helix-turn-helix domain-containing protein [Deltaproteobacteria bacterium]
MKDDLFAELLESVRQGGAILRGKRRPSRAFRFDEPDVRALRESYGLSQAKFAALMGISPGTLRNWEQGRRRPEGSARVLLGVVERHPQAVLDVVTGAPSNRLLERPGRRTLHPRGAVPAGRSTAGR